MPTGEQKQLIRRWARRLARLIFCCAWLLSIVLWLVRGRLTSLGFEREDRYGTVIVNRWYGVVYPGNGSVIAGGQAKFEPNRGQPIDSFDIGGAWLTPRPAAADEPHGWQRGGFVWKMTDHQRWVGVPAWLIVILLGILPVRWIARKLPRKEKSDNIKATSLA